MILEIKDLSVFYDKLEALKGVSLTVEDGTIVSLLGANGAGKTTTLKTVSGLKSPTRGEIWYSGQRIDNLHPQDIVKAGIAHVPEGRRIFAKMSVWENLLMGGYLSKVEEVKRGLEEIFVHFPILKERLRQLGGSLSGGEQQMLAIARALMSRPRLLLLDEPTLGLSPLGVQEVARIIEGIQQKGVSVLLVEQNVRVALRLAQKGYVMERGAIVLGGPSSELLAQSDYVRSAYLGM